MSKNLRRSEDDGGSLVDKAKNNQLPKLEQGSFNITVTPLFPHENAAADQSKYDIQGYDDKLLKPLGNLYPAGSEWREIAEIIAKVRIC